jgi:phage terminase small subunit
MYCVAWSRWTVATAKVQAEGAVVLSPNGYGIPNPWLPIGNKAFDQLLRAARRLQLPY